MSVNVFTQDQIAPCGMNCGVCSAFLAYSHGIQRKRGKISHCSGCRIRPKNCAYIKGQCQRLSKGRVTFCYECPVFPCKHLENIDRRYRTTYRISFIENLRQIQEVGLEVFLRKQTQRFLCRRCGKDVVSVHNRMCYTCDHVTDWKNRQEQS